MKAFWILAAFVSGCKSIAPDTKCESSTSLVKIQAEVIQIVTGDQHFDLVDGNSVDFNRLELRVISPDVLTGRKMSILVESHRDTTMARRIAFELPAMTCFDDSELQWALLNAREIH